MTLVCKLSVNNTDKLVQCASKGLSYFKEHVTNHQLVYFTTILATLIRSMVPGVPGDKHRAVTDQLQINSLYTHTK